MSGYSGVTGTTNDQYKEIFIGPKKIEIPIDWDTAELNDIAREGDKTFIDGDWVESSDMVPNGEYQLIQLGNIGEGHFKGECDKFVSEEFFNQKNCTLVEQGDLLISRLADPVLRTIIVPEFEKKSITAVDIVIAKVDEENWSKKYIWQLLNSKPLADAGNSLATGSTRQRISRSNMSKITIPRPPLPEQCRIADILSMVDGQIQQTESLIEETIQLKKGLAQDLYGENVADDQFPERAPDLPEGWMLTEISELCTVGGGSTPSKSNSDYWGGDILWASPKDFNGPLLEDTEDKLTEFAIDNSSLTTYQPRSIAIVVRSGVLRHTLPVVKIVAESTVNQDVKVLKPNEETVVPEYLFQIMRMQGNRIRQRCMKTGTTVESIETSFLKKYKLRIPPREEQKRIAGVLSTLDTKIRLERENREDLKELKRGLMQDLLTGTVRVDPEQAN